MNLSNKVVVITGASRGIGRATALAFAQQGVHIVAGARNITELEILKKEIEQTGVKCIISQCDVAKKKEVDSMVSAAFNEFERIDILVNNAGMGIYGFVHEINEDDFDAMVDTNFKGVFLSTKAVLPFMMNQQSGHIITVSSVAGKRPIEKMAVYSGTKYALDGFCKSLAKEVKKYNIRVSLIYPGMVNSHFRDGMKSRPAYSEGQKSMMLQNEDIATGVIFMAGQEPTSMIDELEISAPMF